MTDYICEVSAVPFLISMSQFLLRPIDVNDQATHPYEAEIQHCNSDDEINTGDTVRRLSTCVLLFESLSSLVRRRVWTHTRKSHLLTHLTRTTRHLLNRLKNYSHNHPRRPKVPFWAQAHRCHLPHPPMCPFVPHVMRTTQASARSPRSSNQRANKRLQMWGQHLSTNKHTFFASSIVGDANGWFGIEEVRTCYSFSPRPHLDVCFVCTRSTKLGNPT